ncbi:hypothetical protein BD769DRAFT_1385616 [Suillus cothurnatus]|nr:hypothetical protein BD769DRAFT_1385616 [Suillus cothurnatus]
MTKVESVDLDRGTIEGGTMGTMSSIVQTIELEAIKVLALMWVTNWSFTCAPTYGLAEGILRIIQIRTCLRIVGHQATRWTCKQSLPIQTNMNPSREQLWNFVACGMKTYKLSNSKRLMMNDLDGTDHRAQKSQGKDDTVTTVQTIVNIWMIETKSHSVRKRGVNVDSLIRLEIDELDGTNRRARKSQGLVKELVGDDSWNLGDDTTNSYK